MTAYLSDQTEAIDQINVAEVLDTSHQGKSINAPDNLRTTVTSVFGLLMSIPIEYLPRKVRTDLLRRAQAADVTLSASGGHQDYVNGVTVLREFLRRMFVFTNSVEQVSLY